MSEKVGDSQNNRHKLLIKNAFFSALSWFLPIILTVFGTPIIVKGLGYEQFGLYALILSFISYSFTFGIGRVVTKYVAEYRSQEKHEKIAEVISTTFWLTLIFCLFGCSILIVFADFIVRDILQIGERFHQSAVFALYTASGGICFLMIGQVFQSVLQAIHRFDQVSLLITLNGFLLVIGNILLVVFGFGFNALLLWSLFTGALNCFLYYFTARKFLPESKIHLTFDSESAKLVFNYSLGVIGYQIFANVLLIFERSWITRNLGAENLTFYVVPMMLALYLHAFISSLVVVIFPVMSELQNEKEKLLKLYQRATKVVFLIVSFLATTIICSGKLFLSLWINQDFAETSATILIFQTLAFSVFSLIAVVWQLAEGFGFPRFNTLISFLWLLISVPLMIVLISQYEIKGVAFSRLIGNLATIPFILIGERLFLGKIDWKFWAKLIVIIASAVAFTAFAEIIVYANFPQKWITFILGSAIGGICFAFVVWILKFFTSDEINFLKGIFFRKKV